jgi:dTDP-4-dehydrorhamnose 3,5-epimerase
MEVKRFEIEGPAEIVPQRHFDERGYFCETFNAERLAGLGIAEPAWVQDNQTFSERIYTLRGLHFQLPPFAQAKLVRVLKGSIFDVAVDIRSTSPTFGKWVAVTLTAERFNQFYVPAGFAHGFLTLEPDVEVLYKVSAPYSKQHDRTIRWDDPDIKISWPLENGARPQLSDKDAKAPTLAVAAEQFVVNRARN